MAYHSKQATGRGPQVADVDNYSGDPVVFDDCLLTSKCDTSPTKEQINKLLLSNSNFSDILKTATSNLLACEDFNMSTLNTPEIKCNESLPAWPYTAALSNTHSNVFDETFFESTIDGDMSSASDIAMEQCTMDTPSLLKQLMPNGAQQGNFLPASDVAAVLNDVEQPVYTVIDEQPMPVPADVVMRALSHDHDYCNKDDQCVLNEFLDMTATALDGEEDLIDAYIDIEPYARQSFNNDKYRRRRELNNLACKRSRQRRRMSRLELLSERQRLEERNAMLKTDVAHLERLRDEWKRRLLNMVDGP